MTALKKIKKPNPTNIQVPLKPKFENIPEELINHPYWAVWKGIPRKNGKVGKPPVNPLTGKYAKVSDSNTFASYEPESRIKRTL